MDMETFRYFINLFFASFFLISGLQAQQDSCYVRLEDASGYTPTSEQVAKLEAAAAELCAVFDSAGFAGQFKVYDFGFYLHQEVTDGGYPEPFAKKIQEVQDSSPYYLLFGKQTDGGGVYTRFWVDLKLPDSNSFSCLDTAGRTMISLGIDLKVNTQYTNSKKLPYFFHEAEITGMKRLEVEVVKLIECCYYSKGATSCENPCLTPEEIRIYFENNKFNSVPISIINSSSKHSQTLDTNNILTNKINSNNYTNMFEDFSDLNIIMNEDIPHAAKFSA